MFDKLIDLFVEFVDQFRFWQVIRDYEEGVILTFGRYHRTLGPGIHWLAPFSIQECLVENVVVRANAVSALDMTIKDGSSLRADAIVRWKIKDVRKFMLECEGKEDFIADTIYSTISRMLRERTWEQINEEGMDVLVTKECRKRGWRYGIEIESVEFGDLIQVIPLLTLA